MSPIDADDRGRIDDLPAPDSEPTVSLTATVEQYDLQPDECTLYPRGATDEELMRKWVSAQAGSFVSLDEMR